MIVEMSFNGVYFPALFGIGLFCLGLSWCLRRLFAHFGLYRWIWHPALFDLAFYVVLLYLVSEIFFTFIVPSLQSQP